MFDLGSDGDILVLISLLVPSRLRAGRSLTNVGGRSTKSSWISVWDLQVFSMKERMIMTGVHKCLYCHAQGSVLSYCPRKIAQLNIPRSDVNSRSGCPFVFLFITLEDRKMEKGGYSLAAPAESTNFNFSALVVTSLRRDVFQECWNFVSFNIYFYSVYSCDFFHACQICFT